MENTKNQETISNNQPQILGVQTDFIEPVSIDVERVKAELERAKQEDLNEIDQIPAGNLPSAELLKALYHVWEAFDMCNVPYFLVGNTAECAIANRELSGSGIEVGIRRTEWVSGGRRLIDSFLGLPITENENVATYKHEGVPITLHNYEESECIRQLDYIRYEHEVFPIPNPFKQFKEIYG